MITHQSTLVEDSLPDYMRGGGDTEEFLELHNIARNEPCVIILKIYTRSRYVIDIATDDDVELFDLNHSSICHLVNKPWKNSTRYLRL
jgi:hypothetical protein